MQTSESVGKSLVRSNSASSFKSTKTNRPLEEPKRDSLASNHQSISTQVLLLNVE